MGKIYFRYATMNSGKTTQLIQVAHNYESTYRKVMIFKPSIDTRSQKNYVESRLGIKHKCIDLNKDTDIFQYIKQIDNSDVILIDECQFLTKKQVEDFRWIIDSSDKDIDLICYGLKNSYVTGKIFEGSKYLLYYADVIEEVIENTCTFCNNKSNMNLRVLDGEPIYKGNTVQIGDIKPTSDFYLPTCRKHYFDPDIKILERLIEKYKL